MPRRAHTLDRLRQHLPEAAWPPVLQWLRDHPVQVRIAPPRATKLGDYRNDREGRSPRITVNGDLNPYAFLVTLVHEFAHHAVFIAAPRAEPHGAEWRMAYKRLLRPFLSPAVLPPDVLLALTLHLGRPPASSCADPRLMRALRRYDLAPGPVLEQLPEKAVFRFRGAIYVKGPQLRKRFRCLCLSDRRSFLIDPLIEVGIIKPEALPLPTCQPVPCAAHEH
ncbi:MAG: SprT-like domain-containing protein [Flavobacteriales bacterium]